MIHRTIHPRLADPPDILKRLSERASQWPNLILMGRSPSWTGSTGSLASRRTRPTAEPPESAALALDLRMDDPCV